MYKPCRKRSPCLSRIHQLLRFSWYTLAFGGAFRAASSPPFIAAIASRNDSTSSVSVRSCSLHSCRSHAGRPHRQHQPSPPCPPAAPFSSVLLVVMIPHTNSPARCVRRQDLVESDGPTRSTQRSRSGAMSTCAYLVPSALASASPSPHCSGRCSRRAPPSTCCQPGFKYTSMVRSRHCCLRHLGYRGVGRT